MTQRFRALFIHIDRKIVLIQVPKKYKMTRVLHINSDWWLFCVSIIRWGNAIKLCTCTDALSWNELCQGISMQTEHLIKYKDHGIVNLLLLPRHNNCHYGCTKINITFIFHISMTSFFFLYNFIIIYIESRVCIFCMDG